MKIDILGASGGIRLGHYTTAIRLDQQFLIDAGTGLGQLSSTELLAIEHVFISHAHLDHIALLPLLVDSRIGADLPPLKVYALPVVIDALQKHIFNWVIWPDFTRLLSEDAPLMRFVPVTFETPQPIEHLNFSAFPVDHVVPCCGWRVTSAHSTFSFSGDTTISPTFLNNFSKHHSLDALLIECSFPNHMEAVAIASKHITPSMLHTLLPHLPDSCKIWATHLKPEYADLIRQELQNMFPPERLIVAHSGVSLTLP